MEFTRIDVGTLGDSDSLKGERLKHFSPKTNLGLLEEKDAKKNNWTSHPKCSRSKAGFLTFSLIVVLLILPVSGRSATGYEGINIASSLSYFASSLKNNDTNETTELKKSYGSTRLGIILEGGFYLGTVYDTSWTDHGDSHSEGTNTGISIGFTDDGSYIVLHAILESTVEKESSTKYTGTGEGADFGFQMMLGTTLSIGTQLSYRTIHLKKSNANGIETDIDIKESTVIPMLTLGLTF